MKQGYIVHNLYKIVDGFVVLKTRLLRAFLENSFPKGAALRALENLIGFGSVGHAAPHGVNMPKYYDLGGDLQK